MKHHRILIVGAGLAGLALPSTWTISSTTAPARTPSSRPIVCRTGDGAAAGSRVPTT